MNMIMPDKPRCLNRPLKLVSTHLEGIYWANHWVYIAKIVYIMGRHFCVCSCAVRQLEQQVKTILDSIAVSEDRKKELIRGDAVDKAEQLSP